MLKLSIKLVGGVLPEWSKGYDNAGLDLRAAEGGVIPAGKQICVPLGICTAFANNYVGIFKDRSSMAAKRIYTHAGVIDSSYRGEWKALLSNEGIGDFVYASGDKLLQVIFLPCFHLQIMETTSLPESLRGTGGFGSTGK